MISFEVFQLFLFMNILFLAQNCLFIQWLICVFYAFLNCLRLKDSVSSISALCVCESNNMFIFVCDCAYFCTELHTA